VKRLAHSSPALAVALGVIALTASSALARKKPDAAWSVSRMTDPVTGSTTCVVAAYDRAVGMRFSRTGYLYPLVENHPVQGLLVGGGSGGRFRLPTGDILWRVDDHPFRDLRAADNPPAETSSLSMPNLPAGDDPASRAMRGTIEQALRMSSGIAATSTMASGTLAREMLDEMRSGTSLIFRAAASVPDYGLPSSNTYRVGQYTAKGLKPFPLDASFRAGIEACGIGTDHPSGPGAG
jgi:hypothetical protein